MELLVGIYGFRRNPIPVLGLAPWLLLLYIGSSLLSLARIFISKSSAPPFGISGVSEME
jgi:hypothetical protein